ncbi:hypothetical protein [Flavobacterium difficile]|uniref:DUF937 domain-containing protein n=1 Tax=Flavobacterium difficile TaxID=2709659 RepID=A0ABX0I4T8_9FLAO|nr:hypothetical protein [Flavobacterium difficile]NHM01607.1 hypothetical protein [Flavobacterium difficile]
MFEQLTELVKQYGGDAIVNNPAVPNEQNEAVMEEANGSILSGLKDMAASGNIGDLAGMLTGKTPIDMNNPVVAELAGKVTGNLGEKFGLSSEAAASVAGGLIPQVLGGLVNKAQDPNQPGFNIQDIIAGISGGQGGGLMDMVQKYGGQFGLDQDGDGQVGISDAVAAVSGKSGGLGGLLGKLFGK